MPKFFFSSDAASGGAENTDIISLMKNLEERVARLEASLKAVNNRPESQPLIIGEEPNNDESDLDGYSDKEEKLEYQIGQFWFAKVGIIALEIGIAFFLTFPYKNLPALLPGIIGYVIAGVFFYSSLKTRRNLGYISGYLLGGSLLLLYFTTMRLYFFGHENLINDFTLEIILLSIITIINLIISVKKGSIYLSALSLTLGYSTAIICNEPYFLFSAILVLSAVTIYLSVKYEWSNLLFLGIALSYFTHFLWFINNPLMGREVQTITAPQINLLFLLTYLIIFSLGNLFRKNQHEKFQVIAVSFLNAFFGYGLFSLITLSMKQEYMFGYHFLASLILLIIAIIFWKRERSRYSTFIYAILGYLALSTAIISDFKSPDLFILLCWQSFLVVSTAVLFRSKFIVVANFIIYLIIFIAYLAVGGKVDLISISFGIVALLSARILNWKKGRLELKTEQMRNAYLLSALFIIPYALYFAMPESLVSVSWIMAAIIYYVLSLILKNKKYRWMALLTLLLTVVYVFIIGLTSSDPTYKIVSFVALGTVMIIISLVYKRLRSSIRKIIKA